MEKLKMHSPDFTQENIAQLAELFPNCVTESRANDGTLKKAIDFDLLRQELSSHVVEGPRERYHLNWPGKRDALLATNAAIAKTLRPCRQESVDFDTTQNLFIEGDNLEALKLLQETYLHNVKLIYIDPPYNTGNDLIYPDDFSEQAADYLLRSQQTDELGAKLVANTEANGRFHSDWLSMVYPRLKLARNLLAEDGIICMSIGDAELPNARALLSEVFGEQNYINTISVQSKVAAGASGGGEDKRLKKNIEHIIIFARSFDDFNTLTQLYTERPLIDVVKEMRDAGESWKYTSIMLGAGNRVFFKSIEDGDGNPIEIFKRTGLQRTTINKVCREEGITESDAYAKYFDRIFSDTNAQTSIRTRVIEAVGALDEGEILEVEYVPRSGKDRGRKVTHSYVSATVRRVIWLADVATATPDGIIKKEKLGTLWSDFDYNNVGKEGGLPFPDGKKPVDLLRTCIRLYGGNSGIFVDFFAGSGSFGHAVMKENAEDQGSRRFVLVQVREEITASNKYDSVKKFYTGKGIELNVAEVCKARLRMAGDEVRHAVGLLDQNLDVGFRVLKVDTSNMKDVYYNPDSLDKGDLFDHIENIKEDRTPEDLLFQVLLDWGVDLSLPIAQEEIEGKTVFFVDENALVACFGKGVSEDVVKQLAARKPLRVVFRDAGFADDSVKINVEQIFKLMSPDTEVKAI